MRSSNFAHDSVDATAILDAAVKRRDQNLDWLRAIVDLMKALDLDSSLANRKKLARELNYNGDASRSAAMNTWLHSPYDKARRKRRTVLAELMD